MQPPVQGAAGAEGGADAGWGGGWAGSQSASGNIPDSASLQGRHPAGLLGGQEDSSTTQEQSLFPHLQVSGCALPGSGMEAEHSGLHKPTLRLQETP